MVGGGEVIVDMDVRPGHLHAHSRGPKATVSLRLMKHLCFSTELTLRFDMPIRVAQQIPFNVAPTKHFSKRALGCSLLFAL